MSDEVTIQDPMPYSQMTEAEQVIERLRSANVLRLTNIAWPDKNPDIEVAAVLLEFIQDEATEDSVKGRLSHVGIDMSEIDLDYLTGLFEDEHFKQ